MILRCYYRYWKNEIHFVVYTHTVSWCSWCSNCLRTLPRSEHFVNLYNNLRTDDKNFISLAGNTNRTCVKQPSPLPTKLIFSTTYHTVIGYVNPIIIIRSHQSLSTLHRPSSPNGPSPIVWGGVSPKLCLGQDVRRSVTARRPHVATEYRRWNNARDQRVGSAWGGR